MNNTVWLVNKGNHINYSDAERFGAIVPLTSGRVNIFQTDNLVTTLSGALTEAKKDDFVLLSGSAFLNSLVVHYFLKKFSIVKALIYEGNNQRYKVLTVQDKLF